MSLHDQRADSQAFLVALKDVAARLNSFRYSVLMSAARFVSSVGVTWTYCRESGTWNSHCSLTPKFRHLGMMSTGSETTPIVNIG